MITLNIVLFIILLILVGTDFFLWKNKRKIGMKNVVNKSKLEGHIIDLSLNMNNQSLVFVEKDKKIFKLIKYQIKDKWGIKIIIELTNNGSVFSDILTRLDEHQEQFEINTNDISENIEIVIDGKNNIKTIFDHTILLIKILSKSSKSIIYCYFSKVSLEF